MPERGIKGACHYVWGLISHLLRAHNIFFVWCKDMRPTEEEDKVGYQPTYQARYQPLDNLAYSVLRLIPGLILGLMTIQLTM